MNYYEHHLGDYYRKAKHLTMLEHGAYRMLLDLYYIHEEPLPADMKAIQRLAGARMDDEKEAVENVVREFFTLADDGWRHAKCDEEIEKARARIDTARENGKRGGRPKKNPDETENKPADNPQETQPVNSGSDFKTQTKAHQTPDTNHQTPVKKEGEARATRLPENWRPGDDDFKFALGEGLTVPDVEREIAKFTDYWRGKAGKDGRKLDWSATWRNWVRRASESRSSPVPRKAIPSGAGSRVASQLGALFETGSGGSFD